MVSGLCFLYQYQKGKTSTIKTCKKVTHSVEGYSIRQKVENPDETGQQWPNAYSIPAATAVIIDKAVRKNFF